MPPSLVERVPLPSLRNYVVFSVTLFASAALFAWSNAEDFVLEVLEVNQTFSETQQKLLFDGLSFREYVDCLLLATLSQFWSVWVSLTYSSSLSNASLLTTNLSHDAGCGKHVLLHPDPYW